MNKEKVYITRDEGDDFIWVWRKPTKGSWNPTKLPDCEIVSWAREDIQNADHYYVKDFKKKFGITIRHKTRKCIHLPVSLLYNEDYKQISEDPNRKK